MQETRIMRQDNGLDYKDIHLRIPSELARLSKAAASLEEESFSLWVADAIDKKLQAYPFLKQLRVL